ncbi:FG-GAP-like repeat-containing protein [Terriglobus albidus]|uniref:FG-GAP-like repeat-containing protein n=1 Tax=Terriglobus albidus TaxID=1592106 RepID=UPI0021DFF589|nr:FG-GAP-like repeat-containing protein [Terriglobus albidus]
MWKLVGFTAVVTIFGMVFLAPSAKANRNFVPDWTFQGSSLAQFRTLGDVDWHAENGEIVGVPRSPAGGWLILDRSLQDTQFAATFRCTGGCKAGVLLRTQTTADGIHGAYVALPDGQNPAGSFDLKLDTQGRELSREPLKPAGGMVRVMAPPAAPRTSPPATSARPGGGPMRFPGNGLPPGSPYTRPDYSYHVGEWTPLEIILDANIMRVWLHDGPESGTTNGEADDDVASFGPVAFYVGGTGEIRFKDVELKDLGRRVLPDEQISNRFRMQHINDFYYGWSATAADVNHDGVLDIISGPFYYLGPDYKVSREIFLSKTSDVTSQLTPNMVNFAYDYTGDGWPDLLVSKGRSMSLYVNPKGELRRWDRYDVLPAVWGEIVAFKDVNGDGIPDAVYVGGGYVCWATPDPKNPTAPWIVHKISEEGYNVPAQHGIGVGDINGDGRMDIVSPHGWWEQPQSGMPDKPWPYHPAELGRWPRAGGSVGGAEMAVCDVNGDGLNDVVTSLEAHGWGIAWFEQKRDKSGTISFVEHMIIDDYSTKNAGDVTFSEPHGATFADVDGDGIPDFIVGKRVFSHQESYTDPDPFGPAVLYWFRTTRNPKAPGGAEFKPELIHNRSGAGSTILAADLNHDGAVDIVTSTNRGTFIFWGKPKARK